MLKPKELVIASRRSPLAIAQSKLVANALHKKGYHTRIITLATTGDIILDRPLYEIGGKGLFVKELEQALIEGKADIAVHSLKDLPTSQPLGLKITAMLPRGPVSDCLVLQPKYANFLNHQSLITKKLLTQLPLNTLATGSLRRKHLVLQTNSHIKVKPLRGNINSRLKRLTNNEFDALIIASAALKRLSLKPNNFITYELEPSWFVPSPSQGVIACEVNIKTRNEVLQALQKINCTTTTATSTIERGILAALEGDCTMPLGIHSWYEKSQIHCNALLFNKDNSFKYANVTLPDTTPFSEIIDSIYHRLIDTA